VRFRLTSWPASVGAGRGDPEPPEPCLANTRRRRPNIRDSSSTWWSRSSCTVAGTAAAPRGASDDPQDAHPVNDTRHRWEQGVSKHRSRRHRRPCRWPPRRPARIAWPLRDLGPVLGPVAEGPVAVVEQRSEGDLRERTAAQRNELPGPVGQHLVHILHPLLRLTVGPGRTSRSKQCAAPRSSRVQGIGPWTSVRNTPDGQCRWLRFDKCGRNAQGLESRSPRSVPLSVSGSRWTRGQSGRTTTIRRNVRLDSFGLLAPPGAGRMVAVGSRSTLRGSRHETRVWRTACWWDRRRRVGTRIAGKCERGRSLRLRSDRDSPGSPDH